MRTVKEWQGSTDDAMPPASVKRRILDRQDNLCAISGMPFDGVSRPEFDHIVPLWLGGENRESNLQAIHYAQHKNKTKVEATVRAKVNRIRNKELKLSKPKSRPIPGSKASGWRKRMDGTVERRT